MPKVSICIPTYNSAPYLEEALESVRTQTFQDMEVIVSDNCSTDGTDEIASRFCAKDSRFRFERNATNLMAVGNFNKLLDQASGEYINIFHADDVMLPRYVEVKAAILDRFPKVGLVGSATMAIDAEGRELPERRWIYGNDLLLPARSWLLENLGNDCVLCCPFVMMRGELLERVGRHFDVTLPYAGDFEFWLRFALVSDTFLTGEVLGRYRIHAASDTFRQTQATRFRNLCDIWSGVLDKLALPPEELKGAEERTAFNLLEFVRHHIREGQIDFAAELAGILGSWRGGIPGLPGGIVRKLGPEIVALYQELHRVQQAALAIHARAEELQKAAVRAG